MGKPVLSGKKLEDRLELLRVRDIKMVSDYINSKTRDSFVCLKSNCNHVWLAKLDNLVRGCGCPKCSGRFIDETSIQKRIESLKIRSIKLLSPYIGTSKHHDFECLKIGCHHRWRARLMNVLNKNNASGCPKCATNFVDEVSIQKKIDNLELRFIKMLSSYRGSTKHHEFQCLKPSCQHTWKATYDSMFNAKKGCPRCAGQCLTEDEKSINKYRNKIRWRISFLYKTGSTKISVHRDSAYMAEILTYCKTQFNNLPKEPKDGLKWHLDHIIPVTKFDHSDIEQVKLCWDARNIQWLPAKVNISKSDNLMPEYFNGWHYEVLDRLGLKIKPK